MSEMSKLINFAHCPDNYHSLMRGKVQFVTVLVKHGNHAANVREKNS